MALTDGILAYWNLNNDGSGGVNLVDSTGNGYSLTNNGGVTLGTGIIGGDGVFDANSSQTLTNGPGNIALQTSFSASVWFQLASTTSGNRQDIFDSVTDVGFNIFVDESNLVTIAYGTGGGGAAVLATSYTVADTNWHYVATTFDGNTNDIIAYVDGVNVGSVNTGNPAAPWADGYPTSLGSTGNSLYYTGGIDEVGLWGRALSPTEVNDLWNGGAGLTYPFTQPDTQTQYYNNGQEDGDWGNILNWWVDSGFTQQSTLLPTTNTPINLYGAVTQNTQGADQCFCNSASFWSADFGAGLTLQASGVVNMQGTSLLAGTTTDGVSMHDSSQLTSTSVVNGNVVMRDSSRAFGSILGNATIYYDTGNGQYPIGGTVAGSVTYLGWPALTPQYFNDQVTGSGASANCQDLNNWWADSRFTTRPLNTQGTQELPDAGTTVHVYGNGFGAYNDNSTISVNEAIFHAYSYLNTPIVLNVSVDAKFYDYSGIQGYVYGNCYFYNNSYFYSNYGAGFVTNNIYLHDNSGIYLNSNADYAIANGGLYFYSLQSVENTLSYHFGGLSDGCVFNLPSSGGGGIISRLLRLPWFINI